jgi:hypothetical protein
MADQAWPPTPVESPEGARLAAHDELVARYKGLMRRQSREHVLFGVVAAILLILALTVLQPPLPQWPRTLDICGLLALSVVYLTYAGLLDEDIQALRREIEEIRQNL